MKLSKNRNEDADINCPDRPDKTSVSAVASNDWVMPPQLAEVLKTFPLREPDRIVEGPNGEVLAEWHSAGSYFEIEYTPEGKLEIMTQLNCEIKHWTLTGV